MLGPEPQIWSEVEAVVEEGAPHTLQLELSPGGGVMVSILDALDEVQGSGGHALAEGPFLDVLRSAQVAIVLPSFVAIAVRPRPGVWEYVGVNVHELSVEQLTIPEYLRFKDVLVDGQFQEWGLEKGWG